MADWKAFIDILKQVGPAILALNPLTAPAVPFIIHAIEEAEKIQGSGKDKKAHAMAIVVDTVAIANKYGAVGFENPDLLIATVDHGIDTVVGVVNVVQGSKKAIKQ